MIFNMTGGISLNFKVKAYASELLLPETARENTIAVITTAPISGYQISADEPANPEEGYVWISTGTVSGTPISVVKKNPLIIYPAYAWQYTDGAWAAVTAKTYQNGAWMDWITYLYTAGNVYEELTGGYTSFVNRGGGYARIETDGMKMQTTFSSYYYPSSGFHTTNAIDLTKYKTAVAKGTLASAGTAGMFGFSATTKPFPDGENAAIAYVSTNGEFECPLDIQDTTGSHYITVRAMYNRDRGTSGTPTVTITKIWLE